MPITNLVNTKLIVGIVGAGPAGSLLAYRLAKSGHTVHLFERKKETDRKVCGEYLCPKGVELLEDLQLYDKLCLGFDSLHGMVLVSPDNDVIPTFFPRPANREKGLSLNRKIFDERILLLAQKNGARLFADTTVTSVSQNSNGKWLIDASGEIHEYDLLIAADGRQSKIGQLLGHCKNIITKRVALHCYLKRKTDLGQRLGEMHILAEGDYCGLDPISDDEVNFSIVCNAERLKSEKPRAIINDVIKNSKRLSAMFDLIPENSGVDIRIVSSLKNNNKFVAGNNMAYVGDAAGFIDPLTGEGIYNALLSSTILADCLENTEDLNQSLRMYRNKKRQLSFQKYILNNFFQFLIKSPILVKMMVIFLKKSPTRANNFIGIIGNIHDPITGLVKMLKA